MNTTAKTLLFAASLALLVAPLASASPTDAAAEEEYCIGWWFDGNCWGVHGFGRLPDSGVPDCIGLRDANGQCTGI